MVGDLGGYRYLIVYSSIDTGRIIDCILKFERKGVWIQFLPCEYVVSRRVVEISVILAIRDFLRGENIAKKLNLEIALRFFARTQVSEVIEILRCTLSQNVVLVIVCKCEPREVLRELMDSRIVLEVKEQEVEGNIDKILAIYGFDRRAVECQSRVRGLDFVETLEKFVLEKMATRFVMK